MTIGDIRNVCYPEQKVIIRIVKRCGMPDRIVAFGKFRDLKEEVASLPVGHMYTRDDNVLAISVPDGTFDI